MEGCGRLTCLGAIGRLWSWEQVAKEAVEIEDRRVEFWKQRSRTSGSLEASCPKCNFVELEKPKKTFVCGMSVSEQLLNFSGLRAVLRLEL